MFVKLKLIYNKRGECAKNNYKNGTFERLRRIASFLHQPSFGSVQPFLMRNVEVTLELLPGEL